MISKKTDKVIRIILVIAAILTVAGFSYALLNLTVTGEKNYVLSSTGLKVFIDESKTLSDVIGENAVPMTDKNGLEQDSYVFSIRNETKTAIDYSIYLVENEYSTMPSYGVRYNLFSEELKINKTEYIDSEDDSIGHFLYTGSVRSGFSDEYSLKLWLGERAENDCKNKTFSAHISVEAVQNLQNIYVEDTLNGNDPILKDELIPVKINDRGVAVVASPYEKWYSYEENIWANAVILKDGAFNYNIGTEINEDDIESYFVWIPKYDYQIFNMGNYDSLTTLTDATQIINVRFSDKNTADNDTECNYPVVNNQATSGATGTCAVGKWMTHPAFTTMNVKGFWVGKFETGYKGATSTATAQSDTVNIDKIIIKPNVYSWSNITAGKIFKNSYDYKRDLDSHMMKNTEWGAMAYLSASKYGYKDEISTATKRTTAIINNNSACITGYAATEEPTIGRNPSSIAGNRFESTSLKEDGTYTKNYLNGHSQLASTTGNYSGVYDTSGGIGEYTIGYTIYSSTVGGSSGITTLYSNFFSDINYTKYWDKYYESSFYNHTKRILGDATGEMGPFQMINDPDNNPRPKSSWYSAYAFFLDSNNPWFLRGAAFDQGITASTFASSCDSGKKIGSGYRIVLSPTE